jgi:ribosome-binding factor A
MKTHRLARVAEVIREVASETILFELQDPRVKNVTVTRAEVSADLQHAKVYVSVMGEKKDQDLCMHGLRHSAGYVQSKLARRLKTRFTPLLAFVLDQGIKKSIEITRLINDALSTGLVQSPETMAESAPALTDETDGEEASPRPGTPAVVPDGAAEGEPKEG